MASQELIVINSDSEADSFSDNENLEPVPKRKRSQALDWIKGKSFKDYEAASAAIKQENSWRKNRIYKTEEGETIFYYCKFYKGCEAKVKLLINSCSKSVDFFYTIRVHSHVDVSKNRGINPNVKESICRLYNNDIQKPKLILRQLRESGQNEPSKSQLNTYLLSIRKSANPILSMGELAFVLRKVTLQCDATYKLIWQGFPVLLVGCSDKNRTFHPVLIAVCSNEAAEDFRFIFESLYQQNYKPAAMVSDCSLAIRKAREEVWPDSVHIFCWAHVIRSIDRKLSPLKEDVKSQIRADIVQLQLAKSNEEFDAASQLFPKKWNSPTLTPFLDYFKQEYMTLFRGWFCGTRIGSPCTNNGLEATNNVIKTHYTFRNRQPLDQFLDILKAMTKEWSLERNPGLPNCKLFASLPVYDLKQQTEAYNWKRGKSNIKIRRAQDMSLYFIQAKDQKELTDADIDKYLRQSDLKNWRRFDTYVKSRNGIWLVKMESDNWQEAECTCPTFFKLFTCKHILGLAMILKLYTAPLQAKSVPIGQKRKRGRPALAKKALLLN